MIVLPFFFLFNNIYKGALGEVAGRHLFSRGLKLNLDEINDSELFELFDFKIEDLPIYVDFKNWHENTTFDKEEMLRKIEYKAKKCECKYALIVNIVSDKEISAGGAGAEEEGDTPGGLDEDMLQDYLDKHKYVTESDVADLISDDFVTTNELEGAKQELIEKINDVGERVVPIEEWYNSVGSKFKTDENGIYVDEFSNGQVKIGEGDFTFYVKSGYLIEDGVLTAPVKDINIIGNGPEALANILAVGNDLKIDNGTWTCGKEQSVAVSCGMPTILVKSLTVGGE